MKTVKLFSREEIEKAKDIDFFEILDGFSFSNDCAIPWWVDYEDEEESLLLKTRNKVTDYLISQGAEEGELVYIDITW